MRVLECDLLIIGSGLAGLYAAWKAAPASKVIIISKASEPFANSWHAQGGIAAAIGKGDSSESHYSDTIKAGAGLSEPQATQVLVNEGQKLVQQLIDEGLQVDRENGEVSMGLEGGHSQRRVLHLSGDLSGRRIVEFLQDKVSSHHNITTITEAEVMNLLLSHGECVGANVFHHDDESTSQIFATATLLASGGLSALYPRTTNPKYSIGDGIALAYDAGAVLQDMEFIQFHPTALYLPGERAFLISEAVRGDGGKLVNNQGNPFLKSHGELATRDVVTRAIYQELKRSGEKHVNLDVRHLDEKKIKQHFASINTYLLSKNIDMSKELIPVSPAAHYMIGGVKTDINGKTSISGLYAAGEVASTGVMGANRLASNSLLECIVFSHRVIENITNTTSPTKNFQFPETPVSYNKNEIAEYNNLRKQLGEILTKYAGVIRNAKGLKQGLLELNNLSSNLSKGNSYHDIKERRAINTASFIIQCALARNETRGAHYRNDFPDTSTKFEKHSVIEKGREIRFIKF